MIAQLTPEIHKWVRCQTEIFCESHLYCHLPDKQKYSLSLCWRILNDKCGVLVTLYNMKCVELCKSLLPNIFSASQRWLNENDQNNRARKHLRMNVVELIDDNLYPTLPIISMQQYFTITSIKTAIFVTKTLLIVTLIEMSRPKMW